jgi:hypothetical protein
LPIMLFGRPFASSFAMHITAFVAATLLLLDIFKLFWLGACVDT